MPFPAAQNWNSANAQPPAHVLAQLGGSFDSSKYYWNPDTYSLVDRTTGGSYSFDRADPALGTDVTYGGQTVNFAQGQTPEFGFGDSAQGYDAGAFPNSGIFVSADPNEISDYQDHRRDVVNRGYGTVGALVGGAALGGALSGGGAAGTGATIGPNGLPTGAMAASGGGVGALSGGIPAVGASPGLLGGAGAALGAGLELGPNGLPTGSAAAAGGGVGTMSGGVPNVGANPGIGAAVGNALTGGGGGALGNALTGAAAEGAPAWLDYLMGGLNTALGVNAANQASDAQAEAMNRALAENARQYDQSRTDMLPWLTAGQNALGNLQNPNAFQASPDYNFVLNESLGAVMNNASATGQAQSGNALKALQDRGANVANTYFNDWHNRQAGIAGVGQNAASNLGALGANSAGNAGNYFGQQGDARASGYLGRTNAVQQGLYDGYENFLYRRR